MTKSHHRNSQIHLYCIAVLQWQRSLTDILKREAAGENALSRIWFKCEFTHFFTPTVWQQPSVCHRKGRGPPQWPKTYAIRTSFDFLHGNQCLILVIWIKRMWISGVETFCLLFHARSEDRWLVTINLAHRIHSILESREWLGARLFSNWLWWSCNWYLRTKVFISHCQHSHKLKSIWEKSTCTFTWDKLDKGLTAGCSFSLSNLIPQNSLKDNVPRPLGVFTHYFSHLSVKLATGKMKRIWTHSSDRLCGFQVI